MALGVTVVWDITQCSLVAPYQPFDTCTLQSIACLHKKLREFIIIVIIIIIIIIIIIYGS
jgi:hypothetical protein